MARRIGEVTEVIHPHEVVERAVSRVEQPHQVLIGLVVVAPPERREAAAQCRGRRAGHEDLLCLAGQPLRLCVLPAHRGHDRRARLDQRDPVRLAGLGRETLAFLVRSAGLGPLAGVDRAGRVVGQRPHQQAEPALRPELRDHRRE